MLLFHYASMATALLEANMKFRAGKTIRLAGLAIFVTLALVNEIPAQQITSVQRALFEASQHYVRHT